MSETALTSPAKSSKTVEDLTQDIIKKLTEKGSFKLMKVSLTQH
jgi:predicted transcriptional regulator YheO